MKKLNSLENLKQYRVAKSATRLGSAATAKALASVVKAGERTVRQASDFCTSVEKVKKLMELKGWNPSMATIILSINKQYLETLLT